MVFAFWAAILADKHGMEVFVFHIFCSSILRSMIITVGN
jgi:hypothetical protein